MWDYKIVVNLTSIRIYFSLQRRLMSSNPESGFGTDDQVQVFCSEGCTKCFQGDTKIFNILFFEFWGMALFSYVVISYNGIITFPGVWVVETGMFFALVFSGSYGCGYLNPALTLACMIRKENRISILEGLLYWLVQYAAAFVGTFIAWAYNNNLTAPFPHVHPTAQQAVVTFILQVFGSATFLFGVLVMISSDTTFTKNNFQTWFCVPLCLIAVCKIYGLGLGTNPAQAIAFQVAYYAFNTTDSRKQGELSRIWSVIVGATIGGLLAGLLFEFVYRPYTKVYRQQLFENGETKQPLKVSILNNTDRKGGNTRRTTDIEMS